MENLTAQQKPKTLKNIQEEPEIQNQILLQAPIPQPVQISSTSQAQVISTVKYGTKKVKNAAINQNVQELSYFQIDFQKKVKELAQCLGQQDLNKTNDKDQLILQLDETYFCKDALNNLIQQNQEKKEKIEEKFEDSFEKDSLDSGNDEDLQLYNSLDLSNSKKKQKKKDDNIRNENVDKVHELLKALLDLFLQNNYSENFIAGLFLLDLFKSRHWREQIFTRSSSFQFLQTYLFDHMIKASIKDYKCRNLQARIIQQLILDIYTWQPQEAMEVCIRSINNQLNEQIPVGHDIVLEKSYQQEALLRAMNLFLDGLTDERMIKKFEKHVPQILEGMLKVYGSQNKLGMHGKTQALKVFYLCLRCISWADGIENELVEKCLNSTFNQWISICIGLLQIQGYVELKRIALKCLTVIFRDFINYSRECIRMILWPAWNLLNRHLPVFTEQIGLQIERDQGLQERQAGELESLIGFEQDKEDAFDDLEGIEGMTLQLVELLTTLIQRPNVQEVVRQGILPLMMTVSGYMIVQKKDELDFIKDPNLFLQDKTQSVFKVRNIQNQCVELFSSLIEIFGDLAVQSLLAVIEHTMAIEQGLFINSNADANSDNNQINQFILPQQVPEQLILQTVADQSTKPSDSTPPERSPRSSVGADEGSIEASQQSRDSGSNGPQPNNLNEFSYESSLGDHLWKKRDVSILLLGIFIEDIQMFCVRHGLVQSQREGPNNFEENNEQPSEESSKNKLIPILQKVLDTCPTKIECSYRMRIILRGRILWCLSASIECLQEPSDENQLLKSSVVDLAISSLRGKNRVLSLKLVSTRALVKFLRKMNHDKLMERAEKFKTILDDLLQLLDGQTQKDAMHLPIEAFQTLSKVNKEAISIMAPKITPKLLQVFKNEHSQGNLGHELLNLFKQWCQFAPCRLIFTETFLPLIFEIIENYYGQTANEDNRQGGLKFCSISESLSLDSSNEKLKTSLASSSQFQEHRMSSIVDASILQQILDLLCFLLKQTNSEEQPEQFNKIISVFPRLLTLVRKSEDMFLLLHGTSALKNFIFHGAQQILKIVEASEIIEVATKLLSPLTNEQAASSLGNLIIQIFHKIQPDIDTSVLYAVVQKIYKTRMPSTLQSLILIFARLMHTASSEIVELLSETSVDNRISLKVVLDKWLLQQMLFRGVYTKKVTVSALQKLFMMRDSRIESLMVIGYNPSHININSEVNAPFKILSTLLRVINSEEIFQQQKQLQALDSQAVYTQKLMYGARGNHQNYGERLDTMEGYNDLYDDEDEDQNEIQDNDQEDDDLDDDLNEQKQSKLNQFCEEDEDDQNNQKKHKNGEIDKIEVNLDDISDDFDQEELLDYKPKRQEETQLFKIKESNDKGLADMETGSEVYMSELLAGFDMEDLEEADEQNEEDLLLLEDYFANFSHLKEHLLQEFSDFIHHKTEQGLGRAYLQYCINQLTEDDQGLAQQYLFPLFSKPYQQEVSSPQ